MRLNSLAGNIGLWIKGGSALSERLQKRKYGGSEIEVPWFRKSKYPWIHHLRDIAQQSHKMSQKCSGRFNRFLARERNRNQMISQKQNSI